MKIYLATWLLEPSQGDSLTEVKNRNRLVSYFHTQTFQPDQVSTYIQTGKIKSRKKEKGEMKIYLAGNNLGVEREGGAIAIYKQPLCSSLLLFVHYSQSNRACCI